MTTDTLELNRTSVDVDRDHLVSVINQLGLTVAATDDEFLQAQHFAEELMDQKLASLEAYKRVADITGISVMTHSENDQLTGTCAFILLSEVGRDAVITNNFDAAMPAADHLAAIGEPIWGSYAWGGAASTKTGKRIIVSVAPILIKTLFDSVPTFARAVTSDGARALAEHLGYRPLPGTDLYWKPGYEEGDR